jgi:carbamate kinase
MRIVSALGGNALSRRDPMTTQVQPGRLRCRPSDNSLRMTP